MTRIPTHRHPTHPGEMLREEFLIPLGVSQRELADAIQVPFQRVNEIVNGRRGMTPATALRLARFFGVSPEFWMNLQQKWDLKEAFFAEAKVLKDVRTYEMIVAERPPDYKP
jgi:antitoxin HigA-1